MPNTFTKITSVTVGVGGAASVTLSSIPSTYTDLYLAISARSSYVGYEAAISVLPNADGAAVSSWRRILGNGSSASSDSGSSVTFPPTSITTGTLATSNTFSSAYIYIPNYAGSTNKSISVDSVNEGNYTSNVSDQLYSQIWAKTDAITSLYCSVTTGFTQYSTFTLYGIKNS
jgi:hypothetical protein